ncbi:MAG: hypothetical protein ACMUEL_06325 [Flavobacteriales bacterium Tduv]
MMLLNHWSDLSEIGTQKLVNYSIVCMLFLVLYWKIILHIV